MNEELDIDSLEDGTAQQGAFQPNQEMSPDEAAALLAWSTNLSDQALKSQAPPKEVPQETPQEAPQIDEAQIDKLVEDKVSKVLREEMAGLRKELKEMLDEEGED
jgi:hypothetical protein